MKCEHCGMNLQIEDAFCPHCGRENPFYKQHRADMEAYREDYQSTKEEVLENASRISKKAVHITVIAVLAALCAAALVLCLASYDIESARRELALNRHRSEYAETIQAYMAAEDPLELYEYASVNRLTYTKAMEEYSKVFSISSHYSYFYEYLGRLITEDDSVRYRTVEECCEDLAKYAAYILEDTERLSYDKDSYFTEDKITYMTAVTEKMSLLLQAYFGLTPEEIAKIPETSAARLTIMLEEGYHENHESK